MALKKIEGSIAARRCDCGPGAARYTDAEGPRCVMCGHPPQPQLSRMTREWLREAVEQERARRAST